MAVRHMTHDSNATQVSPPQGSGQVVGVRLRIGYCYLYQYPIQFNILTN
jgi:hypothetical protein